MSRMQRIALADACLTYTITVFGLNLKSASFRCASPKGMRIIDKRGIETVLSELRARGEKV